MWFLLSACASPPEVVVDSPATSAWPEPALDSGDTAGSWTTQETGNTSDTGEPPAPPEFDTVVDVIVVGSGSAGMAAALTAADAGASVVMFERGDEPGKGARYGSLNFGAGTSLQAEMGVVDSAEAAAAEWESFTGVPGTTGGVPQFLERAPETLDWLAAHGATVTDLTKLADQGSVPRMHNVIWPSTPYESLMANFTGEVRHPVEVTAPVIYDGRVIGVYWTDLSTGETGASGADAVVLATGGFLRDRAEVDEVRPELAGRRLLVETSPYADGGGLSFLDAVGAGPNSPENIGLYVHSVEDPELPGEALMLSLSVPAILVGEDGARFMNDSNLSSLDVFEALPEGEVYLIMSGLETEISYGLRPGYNWDESRVNAMMFAEITAAGSTDIIPGLDPADLAVNAGIDPDGLQATIDEVSALAATGGTDAFGREMDEDLLFDEGPYFAVRLTPSLAKSFGGISTDLDGRVLRSDGTAIPGLYAAGELVGMIVGGGSGRGFSGSILACYDGGRIAGERAASEASSR